MVRQTFWFVIVVVVFFAGLGLSYAHFTNTYDPLSMKFQNQRLFDQMMSNNPSMSQQWMNSDMMNQHMMNDPQVMNQWMDTMMNDPQVMNQWMNAMMNNPQAMQNMMNNQQFMKQLNQEQNKQTRTSSYVEMVDGVQIVTVSAKEFKFIPSEIHINAGNVKFILVNDGVSEHEMVVYDASKKDIIIKAELAEDEETIMKNILFEIDEIHADESKETNIMNLEAGSYVIGCHVPGHYEAGMKGTLVVNS
ncbi:MAG: cupredoxin domain-containing protein [Nitrosarchaeum sp.]